MLVGGFAVVAVVEVVVSGDTMVVVPFVYAGVSLAVMWWVLGPPCGGGEESDSGDGGSGDDVLGPSRDGDDELAEPPLWREFERELEAYAECHAAVGKR